MDLKDQIKGKQSEELKAMLLKPSDWSDEALDFARQALQERGDSIPEALNSQQVQSKSKDDPFWDDEQNADQAQKNIKFFSWIFLAIAIYQTTVIGYFFGPIAVGEGLMLGIFSVWMLFRKSRIASVLILFQSIGGMAFQVSIRSSIPGASYSGLIIPFGVVWAAICANYATFMYAKFTKGNSPSA